MSDNPRGAQRKQLLAAVSMLGVSLGMSSAAVADQIRGAVVTQKVIAGDQSAQKVRTQSSIKGGSVEGQTTIKQNSIKGQNSLKRGNSVKTISW